VKSSYPVGFCVGDAVVELGRPSLQVAGACSIKIEATDARVVSDG
jgi:hypothetical protein